MLSLANLKMQFRILNKRSRGGEFLRRVFAISTKILIFAVPKTFKVLPFHKLLSGPLWLDAKIGIILFRGTDRKSVSNPPSWIFQVEIYNKQLDKTSSGMTATRCHGYLSCQRETS